MKNKIKFLLLSIPLVLSGCNKTNNSSSESIFSDSSSEESSEIDYGKDYSTSSGRFIFNEDHILSASNNSICINKVNTLEKGTITTEVTQNSENDSGIIFLCSHENTKFFEDEYTSYYFFFISRAGTAYLGKTENSLWTTCSTKEVIGWSINNTYSLTVSFDATKDGYDFISCFVDDEFMFSYKDYDCLEGSEYGLRAGGVNVRFTYPEISNDIIEEDKKMVDNYIVGSGDAIKSTNKYLSASINTILYDPNHKIENGTISMKLYQSGEPSDSGLIFSLTRDDSIHFWESGVSYYFFFIDIFGQTRLSKVINGSWIDLIVGLPCPNYSFSKNIVHDLKVERNNGNIICYVNDTKVIEFIDKSPLIGDEIAIRLAKTRCGFSNLELVETTKFVYTSPSDYEIIAGKAISFDSSSFMTTGTNNILLRKNETYENGKLAMGFVAASNKRVGLIFRSDDKAKSYYMFYVEGGAGGKVGLIKVSNGNEIQIKSEMYLSAGYKAGLEETFEVVIENNKILCFVRGIMYFSYTDNNILPGNRFGLYSRLNNASGFSPVIDNTYVFKGVETLIIGHSYMELWSNYKNDLSKYSDIDNIGIGGSISSNWNQLTDSVLEYKPKRLIYCIGINDINSNIGTSTILNNIKTLLERVHEVLPATKICFVSTNQCPFSINKKKEIIELNKATREYVNSKSSYMVYADLDNAFLDASNNPIDSCFTDGLHPTSESYLVFKEAIYKAFGD